MKLRDPQWYLTLMYQLEVYTEIRYAHKNENQYILFPPRNNATNE